MIDQRVIKIGRVIKARLKPSYGNLGNRSLVNYLLADDFQQELKDKLCILTAQEQSRYPLSGKTSLYIEVASDRIISLPGVLKNIMDACNKVIYSDDSAVEAVLIKKAEKDGLYDSLGITILDGRPIKGINDTAVDMKNSIALQLHTITVLESNYLPYPPDASFVDIEGGLNVSDNDLRAEIERKYKSNIIPGAVAISINIATMQPRVDIDNVALNYLTGMTGIVYQGLTDIKTLHIRMKRCKSPLIEGCIIQVSDHYG